jgi:hypothetical protein
MKTEIEQMTDRELTYHREKLPKYKNDMSAEQLTRSEELYAEQLKRYQAKVAEHNAAATKATGLKHGDRVERFQASCFGMGGETYTGKVIYNRFGRLVIRTDRPDGSGKKTFPINKGWSKI